MKREELKALGLENDAIDKIMDINSADIGKHVKEKEALKSERDNLNDQLSSISEKLKAFEGVDVESLNSKISDLTTQLDSQKQEFEEKESARNFDEKLSAVIGELNGIDPVAIKAHLNLESLRNSNNQDSDIATAVKELSEKKDYLFSSDSPIPKVLSSTPGTGSKSITKEAFEKMGYSERLKLKTNEPETYNNLKES